jgi:hypothetical protein
VIEVFEVRDTEPSDPGTFFVGCLEGMKPDGEESERPVDIYFVLDPLALPKLLTECRAIAPRCSVAHG